MGLEAENGAGARAVDLAEKCTEHTSVDGARVRRGALLGLHASRYLGLWTSRSAAPGMRVP